MIICYCNRFLHLLHIIFTAWLDISVSHVPCVLICKRKELRPHSRGLFSSIREIILQLLRLREGKTHFSHPRSMSFSLAELCSYFTALGRIDLSLFIVLSCLFLHVSKKNSVSHSGDTGFRYRHLSPALPGTPPPPPLSSGCLG